MEDKEFEEKSFEEETIHVEEEDIPGDDEEKAASEFETWTEEFVVAGEELVEFVKELMHEVTVRRIIIRNEKKRILFEIPLVFGLAGIAMLPIYASLALIAALVAECTITVERVGEEPAADEA